MVAGQYLKTSRVCPATVSLLNQQLRAFSALSLVADLPGIALGYFLEPTPEIGLLPHGLFAQRLSHLSHLLSGLI